jgi:hypothetical protein
VLAGKVIALASFIAVGIAIAAVIVAAVAFPLAARENISTSAWTTTSALAEGLSTYLDVLLSCLAWGAFGVMLGMITRSSAIAIAAGVGYFLLGEQLILNSLWPSTEEWLPAGAMSALADGGNAAISFGTAVPLVVAYAVGAYVIAATVFSWRDVTA